MSLEKKRLMSSSMSSMENFEINNEEKVSNGIELWDAVVNKDIHRIKKLLSGDLSLGVDINWTNMDCDGYTCLMRAVDDQSIEIIQLLLTVQGLNINITNFKWGWTALFYAANTGNMHIVQMLLANPDIDVNIANKRGATALSIAARYSHYEAARLLLKISSPHCIYNAAKNEVQGMLGTLSSLKFEDAQEEFSMSNSLLHPGDKAFFSSNIAPDDLENSAAFENDPMVIRRYTSTSNYIFRRIWEKIFGEERQSFYKVKEYLLPVNYALDIHILRACVYVSEKLSRPQLFDNEIIDCIVTSAWRSYGRGYHTLTSLIYVVLLMLVTVLNYRFHDWILLTSETSYVYTVWGLIISVYILNTLFLVYELIQMVQYYRERGLLGYFENMQNTLDWSAHLLTYVAFTERRYTEKESYESSSIMAVATVLLWLKALYYLRPYKSTGPLVRMIFHIFYTIKELMGIFIIIIFGFSQALYLLSYTDDTLDFGTPLKGIINAYFYMLGQSNVSQMAHTSNPDLAQFLLCLFVFFVSILLLNLLIALMNNSYSEIQLQQKAEWNRERAKIMTEQFRPWGVAKNRYEYYLVRESDHFERVQLRDKDISKSLSRIEVKLEEFEVLKENQNKLVSLLEEYIRGNDERLVKMDQGVHEVKNRIGVLLSNVRSRPSSVTTSTS